MDGTRIVVTGLVVSTECTPVAGALAILAAIVVFMQTQTLPLEISRAAVDLDGQSADNLVDPVSLRRVRMADARRGERPVVLLTDEHLPRGAVRVEIDMRLASPSSKPATTPVARIALLELDGTPACVRDVAADALSPDRFSPIAVPCHLAKDTPATLAVFSLGVADLAIDSVRLVWTAHSARTE